MEEWLSKADQFFQIENTHEESKVGIVFLHLDGLASAWHQALVKGEEGRGMLRNWQIYKILITERFEEVLDDPISELKNLKETEGIKEYHVKFELIRARIQMSEEY